VKPTRKQLEAENQRLRHIAAELHWMARRYVDWSRTYVTGMFNDRTRELLRLGVKLNSTDDEIIWARDGMGRGFDGLTDAEATPGTMEARGEATNEA
jgi:hypothetical protein